MILINRPLVIVFVLARCRKPHKGKIIEDHGGRFKILFLKVISIMLILVQHNVIGNKSKITKQKIRRDSLKTTVMMGRRSKNAVVSVSLDTQKSLSIVERIFEES